MIVSNLFYLEYSFFVSSVYYVGCTYSLNLCVFDCNPIKTYNIWTSGI